MQHTLRRTMGLWTAVFYGLGTILGAGIYVLVGNVAQYAGMGTPMSFVIAAVLSLFSVLSYAEVSGRFPHSAGAAQYVHQGFRKVGLTKFLWCIILFSWIASSWALANGFVKYVHAFFPSVPSGLIIFSLILLLCLIAAFGIRMSTFFVVAITLIEVAGLLFILGVSWEFFGDMPSRFHEFIPNLGDLSVYNGLFLGAFLAFYAFIGFEDLVHTAEELKDPWKNLPRAIIITMLFAMIFYLAVTVVNLLGVPLNELTQKWSEPSLMKLYKHATGSSSAMVISLIGIFSIVNGVMVQILMTSRLLYGMAKESWLPEIISYVHPKTRTPLVATAIVFGLMIFFSLIFDITRLANITTFFILILFTFVNFSLLQIKKRQKNTPYHGFHIHWSIPFLGIIVNLFFIVYKLMEVLWIL